MPQPPVYLAQEAKSTQARQVPQPQRHVCLLVAPATAAAKPQSPHATRDAAPRLAQLLSASVPSG